ncbi:MAG: hypothetical protein MUF51_06995 [Vicinamibacteria bacterium]|jgi:FSR family fosmidomycin resistance protein-like MFS transporter|nr:hypothetical protein [Vicinamibacteria bacterium]
MTDASTDPADASSNETHAAQRRTAPLSALSLSLIALTMGHFAVDTCTGIWPVFKTLARLDLARAGLIATIGSIVGNGLQIVFGLLADRGWRRPLLIGGVLLSGAATLVSSTDSYFVMFLLVMATYIGSAAFHPSGTGAAGALSRAHTGSMVGIFLAGGYAGYALSQALFATIYLHNSALTPVILVIPMLAAAGMAFSSQDDAQRPRREVGKASFVWRAHARPLMVLFSIQVFATAINLALVFLLPDLMTERGAPGFMIRGGAHFALIIGACLTLLPAGHAADRFGARRVLMLANTLTGVMLWILLARTRVAYVDLLLVAAFGAFNGMNNVVSVAEGNRMLPGRTSAVSALMMGMPWCLAASVFGIAGALAEPSRGGSPVRALAWISLAIPLALLASLHLRPARADARQDQIN